MHQFNSSKLIRGDRGIISSFGAYQAFYEFNLLQSYSPSSISWIGTIQGSLPIILGLISGPMFDMGYFRLLTTSGSVLVVLGMLTTSVCTEYYHFILAQGLCIGLGAAAIYLPSFAILAKYFTSRRAMASGMVAAGGSIGASVYTIAFRRLEARVGFSWTARAIGLIAMGCFFMSLMIMRVPKSQDVTVKNQTMVTRLIDISAFTSAPFLICSVGMLLSYIGLYIPFFYIVAYAQKHSHVDVDMSFYLLSIMNASSTFGRIIPGLLADRWGSLLVMAVFTVASAIVAYSWAAINSFPGLLVFCIVYGFLSGAVASLPLTVFAALAPDRNKVGTGMGMGLCSCGIGFLVGSPIAGLLVSIEKDSYTHGIIFAGSCLAAGSAFFWIIITQQGRKIKN